MRYSRTSLRSCCRAEVGGGRFDCSPAQTPHAPARTAFPSSRTRTPPGVKAQTPTPFPFAPAPIVCTARYVGPSGSARCAGRIVTTFARSLRWATSSTGSAQRAPSRLIPLARNSLGPQGQHRQWGRIAALTCLISCRDEVKVVATCLRSPAPL